MFGSFFCVCRASVTGPLLLGRPILLAADDWSLIESAEVNSILSANAEEAAVGKEIVETLLTYRAKLAAHLPLYRSILASKTLGSSTFWGGHDLAAQQKEIEDRTPQKPHATRLAQQHPNASTPTPTAPCHTRLKQRDMSHVTHHHIT